MAQRPSRFIGTLGMTGGEGRLAPSSPANATMRPIRNLIDAADSPPVGIAPRILLLPRSPDSYDGPDDDRHHTRRHRKMRTTALNANPTASAPAEPTAHPFRSPRKRSSTARTRTIPRSPPTAARSLYCRARMARRASTRNRRSGSPATAPPPKPLPPAPPTTTRPAGHQTEPKSSSSPTGKSEGKSKLYLISTAGGEARALGDLKGDFLRAGVLPRRHEVRRPPRRSRDTRREEAQGGQGRRRSSSTKTSSGFASGWSTSPPGRQPA